MQWDTLTANIFASLRMMDAEATTVDAGKPVGLYYYGGHYAPMARRKQTEPAWTARLGEMLRERGWDIATEVAYPKNRRKKCDLVVTTGVGERIWIELKGAWKQYWLELGNRFIYESYLFHPLKPGLDQSKTPTAALDLAKLRDLQRPNAHAVALLVIGFDSSDSPMDADIAEFTELAGLAEPEWETSGDQWLDRRGPRLNVKCWLWIRARSSRDE